MHQNAIYKLKLHKSSDNTKSLIDTLSIFYGNIQFTSSIFVTINIYLYIGNIKNLNIKVLWHKKFSNFFFSQLLRRRVVLST